MKSQHLTSLLASVVCLPLTFLGLELDHVSLCLHIASFSVSECLKSSSFSYEAKIIGFTTHSI
jgi:hypothetical protein